MDNWFSEALKILLGAFVGVLFAELWPGIKIYFKRVPDSLRNRRIKTFKGEYYRIKEFKENQSALAVELLNLLTKRILSAITLIAFATITILIRVTSPDVTDSSLRFLVYVFAAWLGIISSDFYDIQRLIDKVRNFEKYREKTISSLKKLGATLDDEPSRANRSKK